MTFQAYLDNIEKQTGVTAESMVKLGPEEGLDQAGHQGDGLITDWLMADYGLVQRPTPWRSSAVAGQGTAGPAVLNLTPSVPILRQR